MTNTEPFAPEPVGLCRLDTQLRYVQINRHLADLHGVSMESHVGQTIGEVLPGAAAAESQLLYVIKTGKPVALGQFPAGQRLYVQNCYPCCAEDGSVEGVRCEVVEVSCRASLLRRAAKGIRARIRRCIALRI